MRFSLIPREVKFHDMFDEAVGVLTRAADSVVDMVTHFARLAERGAELRKEEHAHDEIVERIILQLDLSFITPFDREDIHTLATSLDDVMDNMEETAIRFVSFRIERPPPPAVTLARIVRDCCASLEQALRLCRTMKDINGIQAHLREITTL